VLAFARPAFEFFLCFLYHNRKQPQHVILYMGSGDAFDEAVATLRALIHARMNTTIRRLGGPSDREGSKRTYNAKSSELGVVFRRE
jgi:hypothetical protein